MTEEQQRKQMHWSGKIKRRFLNLVKESGRSSWELLQNITPAAAITHQDMAVALAVAEKALNGKGACRVHGGGILPEQSRHLSRWKMCVNLRKRWKLC